MNKLLILLTSFSFAISACKTKEDFSPAVDPNRITESYFIQFDIFNPATGDSARITKQQFISETIDNYPTPNRDSAQVITEIKGDEGANIVLAEKYARAIRIQFWGTYPAPLVYDGADTVNRQLIDRMFRKGNFGYMSDSLNEVRGILIVLTGGDLGNASSFDADNSYSTFIIDSLTPLPLKNGMFFENDIYKIKGRFNCMLSQFDKEKGTRVLEIRNGRFKIKAGLRRWTE